MLFALFLYRRQCRFARTEESDSSKAGGGNRQGEETGRGDPPPGLAVVGPAQRSGAVSRFSVMRVPLVLNSSM